MGFEVSGEAYNSVRKNKRGAFGAPFLLGFVRCEIFGRETD